MNASRELDHVVRHPVDVPARPRPRRDVSSSRPDFSVAISRALGTIVVTVHGALDGVRSGELRRILGDLIGRHDNRDVVVDLRDMTVADGAHLKLFVDVSRHAWERGGHLTLSGPCHAASEAFARAGLTEALDVQPSGSHRPLYRPGS